MKFLKKATHNKTKITLSLLLSFVLCIGGIFSLSGCTGTNEEDEGKIKIVCTTFVLYDWVREVLGDDIESYSLNILGANGADIHSYQPTVKDITLISKSDMFIHIGGESDSWVEDTLSSAANTDMVRLNLAEHLSDKLCADEHSHEHEESEEHEHSIDEHIWFSFDCSRCAVTLISEALCALRPESAVTYRNNASAYCAEISALERDYISAAENGAQKTAVVADRYPFSYLFSSLGIECEAAFTGCSAESEASFEVIASLSATIDKHSLSYVIVCKNSDKKIADAVIKNTKDKDMQILTLNSLQAISESEIEKGASYLSVMRENLQTLALALSK